MNSYYTDDIVQHLVMALLVFCANNASLVDEDINVLRTRAGVCVCVRVTTGLVFLVSSFASHQYRVQARILWAFMAGGLLFTAPLFTEEVSIQVKIDLVAAMIFSRKLLGA